MIGLISQNIIQDFYAVQMGICFSLARRLFYVIHYLLMPITANTTLLPHSIVVLFREEPGI